MRILILILKDFARLSHQMEVGNLHLVKSPFPTKLYAHTSRRMGEASRRDDRIVA